jgi:hypothetical protein
MVLSPDDAGGKRPAALRLRKLKLALRHVTHRRPVDPSATLVGKVCANLFDQLAPYLGAPSVELPGVLLAQLRQAQPSASAPPMIAVTLELNGDVAEEVAS